jgi:hypothetical protein
VADPPPRVFVSRALPGAEPLTRLQASAGVDIREQERPPSPDEIGERATGCDGLPAGLSGERPRQLVNSQPWERRR